MIKNKNQNGKFIFITGGVVSSVGKGLVSASLATLMEARGFKISVIKCDPYINVDPGTLSPFQHGEVYVTNDGAETDLDLVIMSDSPNWLSIKTTASPPDKFIKRL